MEARCGVNDFQTPVLFHLTLLRETGFRKIHVFWQSCLQAGICAVKQAQKGGDAHCLRSVHPRFLHFMHQGEREFVFCNPEMPR